MENLIDLKQYNLARKYLDSLPPATTMKGDYQNAIFNSYLFYYIATGQYGKCYPYLIRNDSITLLNKNLQMKMTNELSWFRVDSGLNNTLALLIIIKLIKT